MFYVYSLNTVQRPNLEPYYYFSVSHTMFKKIMFKIFVTCNEVRKEGKALVELIPEDRDYALYFNGIEQETLSELTKELKEDSNARACRRYFK